MNRHGSWLGLIGASVAAGIFPTFHPIFAADLAERDNAGPGQAADATDSAVHNRQEAESGPDVPVKGPARHAFAWQPAAI
jgi:hypothetical protein